MADESSRKVVAIENLSYSYGGPKVLDRINLDVFAGEFLGIIGPNAGGKSTLLKLLLGLIQPQRGNIRVFGRPPEQVRGRIGYIPQYPSFSRDFPITVEQVILTGRLGCGHGFGSYSQDDRQFAQRVMQQTEVIELAQRQIETLSGGQIQRVLLARALVSSPEILILDEPTANIDMRVEIDIFDLLSELNQQMTILLVSHDVAFISKYVHRVACLNRTLLCHRTEDIDGQTIQSLYGEDVRMVAHSH